MNRSELVAALVEETGVSKKDVELVVRALAATITREVREGGKVQIPDLGTFRGVSRESRMVRNPRTGETVESPACTVAKFTAAKAFKEAVK